MHTNILNIKINTESKAEILHKVELLLQDKKQHYIVTPNPEIVLASVIDYGYMKILNQADIQICDGFGLKLASYFTENKITELIKGVDFIKDICRLAVQKKCSLFLLGSAENTALIASKKLKEEFPELNIVGADNGGVVDIEGNLQDLEILAKIKDVEPDILFVGFGHPKQEKFIDKYLKDLPSVKLAMAVGGSFDLISGNIKRAPKLFRSLNLEWLYRLLIQPSRINRIYDAVVRFPFVFIKWRLKLNQKLYDIQKKKI
jgi:N-acetylglucosaminyldiphosphoundecaprenol N-acetyl-beta-D-mannosaminyltransferase